MAKARTTDESKVNGPIASPFRSSAPVDEAPIGPIVVSQIGGRQIVQIEVPLTEQPPPTEFVFHVDCKLTPQQSTVARRLAQQLDLQNACLNNGQRIVNVHGALKWLLEQIGNELQ